MSNPQPQKSVTDFVHVGVFGTLSAADAAVERLHAAGFKKEEITVVCKSCARDEADDHKHKPPAGAAMPKAAAGGGAIGAILGGFVAVAGFVATGGVGLLIAGPLILGAAEGGVIGGFIGAMLSRGIETESTEYYAEALGAGKVVVSVEVAPEGGRPRLAVAEQILRTSGAAPIALKKS